MCCFIAPSAGAIILSQELLSPRKSPVSAAGRIIGMAMAKAMAMAIMAMAIMAMAMAMMMMTVTLTGDFRGDSGGP